MAKIIEVLLNEVAKRVPQVFCLQVGAMNGVDYDPIYPFIKKHGWAGLLIEPLPDIFQELQANYLGHNNLILENCAVTEKEEVREITRIPREAADGEKLPEWARGVSSFTPERNALGGVGRTPEEHARFKQYSVKQQVQCFPLVALLAKHKIRKIDVLQIDTEGFDFHVLKQVNFNIFRPFVINMEFQLLPEKEQHQCLRLLQHFGYTCFGSGIDLTATIWPVHQPCTNPAEFWLPGDVGPVRFGK